MFDVNLNRIECSGREGTRGENVSHFKVEYTVEKRFL